MSQQPSLGRIVLAVGARARTNGTDVAPAIITRVWSQGDDFWTVNATIFLDAGNTNPATSVRLYTDEEQARASLQSAGMTALSWPPRVGS